MYVKHSSFYNAHIYSAHYCGQLNLKTHATPGRSMRRAQTATRRRRRARQCAIYGTNIYIYICTHICLYICIYVIMCIYIYIYTHNVCMYLSLCIYMYIYIYIYTCIRTYNTYYHVIAHIVLYYPAISDLLRQDCVRQAGSYANTMRLGQHSAPAEWVPVA